MPQPTTWLIDFDETLASGNITWAFQNTFPKFIRDYHLNADAAQLRATMLILQERASRETDPVPLLEALFTAMDWPRELQQPLLQDVFSNYRPDLFADTLPFLQRLRQNGQRVLIVSNNPRTPEHARLLELESWVDQVLTPETCPGTSPKPDRSLWDYIAAHERSVDPENTRVVGDDPWSDGAFADACGLPCWIVDRLDRFAELCSQKQYQRVRTLAELTG